MLTSSVFAGKSIVIVPPNFFAAHWQPNDESDTNNSIINNSVFIVSPFLVWYNVINSLIKVKRIFYTINTVKYEHTAVCHVLHLVKA
jgi:hypothetical protein